MRIGGSRLIPIDVRVIANSNKDLVEEAQAGRFREDLFFRLSVLQISIVPLRQRSDDIPLLAEAFIGKVSKEYKLAPIAIPVEEKQLLVKYSWPGNVRQLRNVIEWVIIMASNNSGEIVNVEMLPPELGSVAPVSLTSDKGIEIMGMALREAREHFEREYLMAQVDRFGGNISQTAVFIGMERSALHRKLKSLGVN